MENAPKPILKLLTLTRWIRPKIAPLSLRKRCNFRHSSGAVSLILRGFDSKALRFQLLGNPLSLRALQTRSKGLAY